MSTNNELAILNIELNRRKAELEAETERQLADLKVRIAEQRAKLEARWEILRNNPDFLAGQIAASIRRDSPERSNVSATKYDNHDDKLAWNQGTWGEIRKRFLEPVQLLGDKDYDDTQEVETFYAAQCATTACVAGHAGVMVGYQMLVAPTYASTIENPDISDEHVFDADEFLLPDQTRVQINESAAQLLRMDYQQMNYLFSGDRTQPEVLEVLDIIATGNYNWFAAWVDDTGFGNYAVFDSVREYENIRGWFRAKEEYEEEVVRRGYDDDGRWTRTDPGYCCEECTPVGELKS